MMPSVLFSVVQCEIVPLSDSVHVPRMRVLIAARKVGHLVGIRTWHISFVVLSAFNSDKSSFVSSSTQLIEPFNYRLSVKISGHILWHVELLKLDSLGGLEVVPLFIPVLTQMP